MNVKSMRTRRQPLDACHDSNPLAVFFKAYYPMRLAALGRVHNGDCLFTFLFFNFTGTSRKDHSHNEPRKQHAFDGSSHLSFSCCAYARL